MEFGIQPSVYITVKKGMLSLCIELTTSLEASLPEV